MLAGNTLAEGVGFEPTEACTSHAFEACPFGRSGTLPGRKVNGCGVRCHQQLGLPHVATIQPHQPRHFHSGKGKTLKVKKPSAEELHVHADLFAREGGFTPRAAWQVIEAARRQMLTGELSLATTPRTQVYLRDGQIYFAERSTDGGLGVRLLVEGVITRQQMGKGALLVGGVEHLGRMFQRDPSIERQSVELCVELMTDDVLTSVANDVVEHYTMAMYKRHPNGIDRWLPTRIEVITHIVEGSHLTEPDSVITPGPRGAAAAVVEPAAVEPAAVEPAVVAAEPTSSIDASQFSLSSSISSSLAAAAAAGLLEPNAPLTAESLFAENPHDAAAVRGQEISLAQSAVDAIMSSAIADEVAAAVRRALAAIDAAAQPIPNIVPADFVDAAPGAQHGPAISAA